MYAQRRSEGLHFALLLEEPLGVVDEGGGELVSRRDHWSHANYVVCDVSEIQFCLKVGISVSNFRGRGTVVVVGLLIARVGRKGAHIDKVTGGGGVGIWSIWG